MVPHVIEPRRPRKRQVLKEAIAVRRLDEIDEIVVVIARAAQKVRLSVQEEPLADHF